MIKNTIIIALVVYLLYLYYQKRKRSQFLPTGDINDPNYQQEVSEAIAELREEKQELEFNLSQALTLQEANKTKLAEQVQEISNLKNRLNVYEGMGASSSGENEQLKVVLNERDELKRTNQNLTTDLNSILTE